MMDHETACPCCAATDPEPIFEARGVPVHDVLPHACSEDARHCSRGDIALMLCAACGYVFNATFDANKLRYGPQCQETQAHSGAFDRFHLGLARGLVERHGLQSKDILEVGCGKGDFLRLLCELGGNRGLGFDPAFDPNSWITPARGSARVRQEFFDDTHTEISTDFVVCKMTLEHVPHPANLVNLLRGAMRLDGSVFFMVPDMRRILEQACFWDVYYEHCGYFCRESLGALLETQGFQVLTAGNEYKGQYLTMEAGAGKAAAGANKDIDEIVASARTFGGRALEKLHALAGMLDAASRKGSVAVWGGGSKAVSLLNALGPDVSVECVVDINPRMQGKFLAGTGHAILAPDHLKELKPALVLALNPVYKQEIRKRLDTLGLDCELETLD